MTKQKDIHTLPTLGVLYLGKKLKNGLPKAVNHFICKPGMLTSHDAVEAFRKVYGKRPRKLFITLPCENENAFFSSKYKRYGQIKKGDEFFLLCSGDGRKANCVNLRTGRLREKKCDPVTCQYYGSRKCRLISNLRFILPSVPLRGTWGITISGFSSIVAIETRIDALRRDFRRVSGIPLELRIVRRAIPSGGKRRYIYSLRLNANADRKIGSRKRRD